MAVSHPEHGFDFVEHGFSQGNDGPYPVGARGSKTVLLLLSPALPSSTAARRGLAVAVSDIRTSIRKVKKKEGFGLVVLCCFVGEGGEVVRSRKTNVDSTERNIVRIPRRKKCTVA